MSNVRDFVCRDHQMMKVTRFACVSILMLGVGGCKVVQLRTLDPIAAAPQLDETQTAIKKALSNQGWMVNKEEPGKVYAALHIRVHTIRILISYDADEVGIQYLGSTKLKYHKAKNGKEYIHKNYHVWIKRLLKDISKFSTAH